jgi:hypothetical protein
MNQNETPKFDTMKKTMFYMMIPFALVGIGFVTVPTFLSRSTPSVQIDFSQKVNLALRQTAHRLLKQAGDSTSRIAPIKQTQENTYLVELGHSFNYDSLPTFLQKSFVERGIQDKYEVAVWDCSVRQLILGYTSVDVSKNKDIPCQGRDQTAGCLNFTVTFTEQTSFWAKNMGIWFILGGLFLSAFAASAYFFFLNSKKKEKAKEETTLENNIQIDETHLLQVGKSVFDTRNQTFTTDAIVQKLTSRESKLLQLFCKHPNELLDRDFILKSVWEDEGVLVTRTVDVFISRLRKILKDDESLKITNVHSRGYRFEV